MTENSLRPLKIILVGSSGVGKTSLINAYFDQPYKNETQPTVAPAFCCSSVRIPSGESVDLHIWDTAGQERFQSIGGMFYRDSDVAFICFNVETIDTIPQWISKVLAQGPDCIIFLVLTKEDLLSIEEKEKILNDSTRLMEEYKAKGFYLTSAATGNGVANLFQAAGRCIEDICSISAPSTVEIQKNDKNDCKC